MPRRRYRSVEELRGAVAVAMERLREGLGQGVLQSLCIGTYKHKGNLEHKDALLTNHNGLGLPCKGRDNGRIFPP